LLHPALLWRGLLLHRFPPSSGLPRRVRASQDDGYSVTILDPNTGTWAPNCFEIENVCNCGLLRRLALCMIASMCIPYRHPSCTKAEAKVRS
jgi:hypothetical protein